MMNMIREYILKRQSLACLFLLIDTRLEMQKADRQFLHFLGSNQIPFTLIFTKTDKITPSQVKQNIEQYKKTLLETWESLPPVFQTSALHKKGRKELLEFIRETHICKYFFIAQRPRPAGNSVSFDLVIFTGLKTGIDYSGTSDKINRKILTAMGKEYCPDNILFYPVLPRLNADGSVDEVWCQSQYASGGLSQKSKDDIFIGLSVIKELLLKKV